MTIHHHSHGCPLVRHEHGDFTCDGCGRGGRGARYRCHGCDFDLHLSCATYNFPCHGHPLKYQPRCPSGVQIICDACNSNVCGAHYGCAGCDFQVHPACVQRRTTVVPPQQTTNCTPRPCGYCTVYCVYCVRCNPGRRCG
ncbi:hypothetical protein ZWY2020_019435 [Hordeum vulgare]|nr:hypothetical protein ZWY2020_019435 [Hordeum vulgare]